MLENFNRRLGGHQLVLEYIQRLLGSTRTKSLSILDLATGIADIPRAIAGWARQRRLPVTITAVDSNPQVLQIANEFCRDCGKSGWNNTTCALCPTRQAVSTSYCVRKLFITLIRRMRL